MTDLLNHSYTFTEISDFVEVGKYSSIAANVKLHGPNDNHLCITNRKCVYTTNWGQTDTHEKTIIGNDVWICDGARIMSGVHIGDGAIVGAGAVVAKDVPPYAVIVGNPQEITRFRFTDEQMKELLTVKWWDLPHEEVEKLKEFMQDIDVFLLKYHEYHG